jgi:CheY-like chemotaxis protein
MFPKMVCRNICQTIHTKIEVGEEMYFAGKKYCRRCEIFLYHNAFKERKKSYALALLDIKMPKMGGFELYNEIRKEDDKVKVYFVTACDIQKEDEEDLKDVATSLNQKPAIIRKPISIDDLVQKVKEELGIS